MKEEWGRGGRRKEGNQRKQTRDIHKWHIAARCANIGIYIYTYTGMYTAEGTIGLSLSFADTYIWWIGFLLSRPWHWLGLGDRRRSARAEVYVTRSLRLPGAREGDPAPGGRRDSAPQQSCRAGLALMTVTTHLEDLAHTMREAYMARVPALYSSVQQVFGHSMRGAKLECPNTC